MTGGVAEVVVDPAAPPAFQPGTGSVLRNSSTSGRVINRYSRSAMVSSSRARRFRTRRAIFCYSRSSFCGRVAGSPTWRAVSMSALRSSMSVPRRRTSSINMSIALSFSRRRSTSGRRLRPKILIDASPRSSSSTRVPRAWWSLATWLRRLGCSLRPTPRRRDPFGEECSTCRSRTAPSVRREVSCPYRRTPAPQTEAAEARGEQIAQRRVSGRARACEVRSATARTRW